MMSTYRCRSAGFMGAFMLLALFAGVARASTLQLQPGYVYRLRCEGRLLVSAVGNEQLLRLDALPRELGCGAVLKALQPAGRTNLILETSVGTIIRTVEVSSKGDLGSSEIRLSAGDPR